MSPSKRILLNVIATYGRSLYALVVGLFTARWALLALGQVDYGLLGLIGGLAMFVAFFNNLLAQAIMRFYAVSVGAAKRDGNMQLGLEECVRWFNTAVSIHTILPAILIVVGYPAGVLIIRNFLEIPVERIDMCVYVWLFTCITCFVGMLNVPFTAMYNAHQEIAELTVYSFFTTTINAVILFYMVNHPRVWIVKYSFALCALSVVPQVIICIRAVQKYPECTINKAYLWDLKRVKSILVYAWARFVSAISGIASTQVPSILVNKYMGPQYNASMTVGSSVANHSMTLANAVSNAFWTAIANKAGEGDEISVRKMSFMTCRLSSLLIMIFAIPLSIEINSVLKIWLVTPPEFAAELCVAILAKETMERTTDGYWMAILSFGRSVMRYSIWVSLAGFLYVGITWLLFGVRVGMWSVCIGLILYAIVIVGERLWLGWQLVSFRVTSWSRQVAVPLILLALVAGVVGVLPSIFLDASLVRVVITTILCEFVLLPGAWFFVLTCGERAFVVNKLKLLIRRSQGGADVCFD